METVADTEEMGDDRKWGKGLNETRVLKHSFDAELEFPKQLVPGPSQWRCSGLWGEVQIFRN